jgi:5-methyltetrahydrofolate--homocysteine methyltransferase
MSRLLQALGSGRTLLMDGAMGTELLRAGLPPGSCGEEWNRTHPGRVLDIHRAYRRAGAEVLLTNTFQANPRALARHGLADQLDDIAEAGVRLARQAAGPRAFVLGDIGPILGPEGYVEFADRRELHAVLTALEGVDGFLLETCSSPKALAAVEYALRGHAEAGAVPLLLSLTYRRDAAGRVTTFSGHGPATFARHAARHGAAALGVNCGRDIGPREILDIIHCYRG